MGNLLDLKSHRCQKLEKAQETEEAQYTAQQVCQRWLAEQSWRSAEPCAAPSAACFGPIIWSFFQQVEPPDAPSLFILYISSMSRKEFTCFEDQSQNLHSPFVAEVVGPFSSFSSFFSVFFSRVDTKRIQELICRRFDFEKILRCCITPQVRTLQGSPEMIITNL